MSELKWRTLAESRFQHSCEVPTQFFAAHADPMSRACLAMAKRFERGGRLLVFGSGAAASDAQHVAVEFVHPVIVGKRALSAIALPNDIGTTLGFAQADGTTIFARQLRLLGNRADIALGLSVESDAGVTEGIAAAKQLGMLTIDLRGGSAGLSDADYCFAVPSADPYVVQEVQETVYHVLWETVHVFFEHKDLLG